MGTLLTKWVKMGIILWLVGKLEPQAQVSAVVKILSTGSITLQ